MSAGYRTALPFIAFSFGGGSVIPIAPLPTTATTNRALVTQLNIRSQASRIQGFNTDMSSALYAIQNNSDSVDDRLRRLNTSLNSVGLTRDAAGNVAIQGATFTVGLPLQSFSMVNQSVVVSAPPAPLSQPIPVSSMTWYLDEGGGNLVFKVTYSNGTIKTATVPLV